MNEKLIEFIEYQLSLCEGHMGHYCELFMHNAYGAVLWESMRTGDDLEEFWEPYKEKFEKKMWR